MCSSRRHGWVGEHGGPKAEADQHCCVGWCETSAQYGEARPAHCPTYRNRPERPDLFRVQTLTRAERVAAFLERLTITSGAHAGRNLVLRPWQRDAIAR